MVNKWKNIRKAVKEELMTAHDKYVNNLIVKNRKTLKKTANRSGNILVLKKWIKMEYPHF